MVYKKYPSRRRTYKRKPQSTFSKYGPSIATIASAAATMVARRYLNSEFKLKDTTDAGTGITSTGGGIQYLLNGMTKGDDYSTRDGRSIRVTSINTKMSFNLNASATATRVRAVLVCSKSAQGNALTWSDVFSGNATVELRNPDGLKDYKVYKDMTFVLNTDYPEKTLTHYFKVPYQTGKTKYNSGNVGSIADIENNAWYWLVYTDEATNGPTVQLHSRIRFLDN